MISKELAYWTGVAQSDGYFKQYKEKRKGKFIDRCNIVLGVKEKSFPMLYRFQKISRFIFKTNGNFHINKKDVAIFSIRVKNFIEKFKELNINFSDPPKPPKWCVDNQKFFGAYLAGVIDGDGDIRISRKEYPYCAIRITSGKEQKELRDSIINSLKCGCNHIKESKKCKIDGREFIGTSHRIEFYVSSKNYELVEKYILPEITIPHKKRIIDRFIKLKIKESVRDIRLIKGLEPASVGPQPTILPLN